MMKDFDKYIDNPFFFKWIFNSNDEIDLYWKKYMEANSDEVEFIKYVKNNLEKLTHNNDILTEDRKKQLSLKIKQSLERENQKLTRIRLVNSVMRYAAVAVLFSCISGVFVYFQMKKDQSGFYDQLAVAPMQVDEPTLILSESDKIGLRKSESTVDYSKRGEIVLNKERVFHSSKVDVQKPKIHQMIIPFGNSSQITLADGTQVWLNAGSRLVYPSSFTEKNREVRLYGEAFFDVARNEAQPFIVKTTALDIKVLGTEFNVSAYPDDKIIKTVLKEGSVAIRKKGASLFSRDLILKPDQLNVFHKDTEYSTVYNVNATDYTIWVDGLIKFEDEQLSRVIKKVERYYNTWISYENTALGNIKITGKLDLHQNVEEVLEYLSKVSRNKYQKISDNKYVIK